MANFFDENRSLPDDENDSSNTDVVDPDKKHKDETEVQRLNRKRWALRDVVVTVVGVLCLVVWSLVQPRHEWSSWYGTSLFFAIAGLIPTMFAFIRWIYYAKLFRAGRWLWIAGLFVPWFLTWIFDGRPFWGHSMGLLLFVYFACATYLFFRGFLSILSMGVDIVENYDDSNVHHH